MQWQKEPAMQANTSDLQNRLIEHLQDMCAVEKHLDQVLQAHEKDAADFPVVQAKIRQHLVESQQHYQRLEGCLNRYGKRPGGGKNALTGVLGKLEGALAGTRKDTLARNTRDDYVAEHFEIAAYDMLIAIAQACGDQSTVQACQANLRDEINMAFWLESHTAEAALASLLQEHVAIPTGTITQIQQHVRQEEEQLWRSAQQQIQQDTLPIFH
jgi:ferritin-like metal-binding protein YciE